MLIFLAGNFWPLTMLALILIPIILGGIFLRHSIKKYISFLLAYLIITIIFNLLLLLLQTYNFNGLLIPIFLIAIPIALGLFILKENKIFLYYLLSYYFGILSLINLIPFLFLIKFCQQNTDQTIFCLAYNFSNTIPFVFIALLFTTLFLIFGIRHKPIVAKKKKAKRENKKDAKK